MMMEMERMQELGQKEPTPSENEAIIEKVGEYLNESEVISLPVDR